VDTIVVGAGVVGLAIARAEALAGRAVLVLEAERRFGLGTSSRNSEVIHAGIFQPTESLRSRLCVAGRRALYRYCAERGIPHRRTGKLLVATVEEDRATLGTYVARARAHGFAADEALVALTPEQVRAIEPEVRCVAGLLSPATGIVDARRLMAALVADLEAAGGVVAYGAPVLGAVVDGGALRVTTAGSTPTEVRCERLINAAGLGAPEVARGIVPYDAARVPRQHLTKGSYFTFAGRSPFGRPIYPVYRDGLSIHATIDLGGRLKLGPDAEPVDALDYTVDPRRADAFYGAVRRYWPHLPDGSLQPGYAGIRPRLHAPGEAVRDFVIEGPRAHGVAGLVQLFGIESPGLTACLAIAGYVRTL